MEIGDLFAGIAVIIDDEIGIKHAKINDLISQLEDRKIPCLKSKELLEIESIRHLGNASFLILDWKLKQIDFSDVIEGVTIPPTVSDISIGETIDFLKTLTECFFSPIFIFTDEDKQVVIDKLRENNLYQDQTPNVILVKNKDELIGDKDVFSQIREWLMKNPSIYVLKKWEAEYQNAKNDLFLNFYKRSPLWPKVLWKAYLEDGIDASRGIVEVITKNVSSRMAAFDFEKSLLEDVTEFDRPTEVRSVLEGERFIRVDQLKANEIFTGDIFIKAENPVWKYLINIRAQCDLRDNPELYCLRGRVVDEGQINSKDGIPFKEGEFREKKNQAIVSCIDNGKIIEFSFRDLKIEKWNSLKNYRIGRLLPPYITRIQQLFGLYFQRMGLPRTPEEIFEGTESTAALDTILAATKTVAAANDT